jgi:hypothetical protein
VAEGLFWPPKKEDLERLYVVERLSASRIARVYGLKYRNPKVAESTVLYQLKRNGIKRRDAAEHIKKVTEEMADEWVRRYETGESLNEIASGEFSPVTVFLHLRKRGVELRDKVEAQIQAVTKYQRKSFQGDTTKKAYLMGLRYGDLDAVRHGRAIRVRVSTTHPAMADLFESIFSPYGQVHRYPRRAPFTGYEWTLECDLDDSFSFLLRKSSTSELDRLTDLEFQGFLAGFFDAEGSNFLHLKSSGLAPEANITNTDLEVLKLIAGRFQILGIRCKLAFRGREKERGRFKSVSPLWRLDVWRFESVRRLMTMLQLRHAEKTVKASLAIRFVSPISEPGNLELVRSWKARAAGIEGARKNFIEEAKRRIETDSESN